MRNGLTHWALQRISALLLIPALLALAWWMICAPDFSAGTMIALFSQSTVAWFVAVAIAAVYLHAGLGIQTVVEDYISHQPGQKLLILLVYALLATAYAGVLLSLFVLHA